MLAFVLAQHSVYMTLLAGSPCVDFEPGTAAKVSEVCVETTVVVDTLGPARRRTHGLCVTVRCQWKKKDRLRQQESHNETICIAFAFPFVFIHCFMGSFHHISIRHLVVALNFQIGPVHVHVCLACLQAPACLPLPTLT